MSGYIQSIGRLFCLHLICPYNQTLHYHFRNSPLPCASPYILLYYVIWLYWFYTIIFYKYLLVGWYHTIYLSDVSFTLDLLLLSDSTLSFYKIPPHLGESIHSIDPLKYDSIDFTLSFQKISPCWLIPFNISIRCFIYIRFLPTIILCAIIFENPSPHFGKSIHSIDQLQSNKIYFTISFKKYPLVELFHIICRSAVSFKSDLSIWSDSKERINWTERLRY